MTNDEHTPENLDSSATIKLPVELLMALSASEAASVVFDGLAAVHQREYIDWIEAARGAAAREERTAQALQMLLQGDGKKR